MIMIYKNSNTTYMYKILKSLLLLVLAFGYSHAQRSLSEDLKENLNIRVKNGENAGIVIGIIDAAGTSYYSFGVKSLDTNEPVDEHTVFEIGSISKAFTGILLADQVKKGQMNLDDPIQNYLPDNISAPTRNGSSIQLIHLANHTSGLPRLPTNFAPANPGNPYADYSEKQLFEFLTTYELTRDIGSQYEYSNYAVGLLGHLLALNSDQSYEELLVDVIAQPLGLKNTRIELTSKMKKNLAQGYFYNTKMENWDLPTLAGAGAIRSTASDMIKFLSYNMGLKSHKLYEALQLSHQNSRGENSNPIVGLGWHQTVSSGIEIIWHNGGTGGYRSFAGFTKDGKRGVVVLTNSAIGIDDVALHLLNPKSPLREVKPSIGVAIREVIEKEGLSVGLNTYAKLKKEEASSYNFGEAELERLGQQYLESAETDKAISVFELNLQSYPESSNAFNSLGEAYLKKGEKEKAIENYTKSFELNPGNQNAIVRLKELGVDPDKLVKEIEIDTETLESYTGKYELVPGFIITITREESQLNAQATGQSMFPIFPKSENVFFFKVVEAQLTFNKGEDGTIESITLLQAGREMVGKKL